MKITFLIGSMSGGGAERVICELASFLCVKGYETDLITVSDTEKSYPINENVRVVSLEGSFRIEVSIIRIFIKMLKLHKYIKHSQPDIYVVFLPKGIHALTFFKRIIKAPIIISERIDPTAHSRKVWKQLSADITKVNGIVFQTKEQQQVYFQHGIDISNSTIIPNAINPVFDREPYVGERKKNIVAVGRMTKQKNFDMLIRSFKRISSEFPGYSLTIYGQGELLEENIALAESLGVRDRVIFPGYVSDIGEEIRDASLFVLSSDFEGMPNALMEAMALGLPCISTNCGGGGARFLINDRENGLLVPIGDIDALADAMKRVLTNPEYAQALASNAVKIKDRLSSESIYKQWEKYLISMV